MAVDINKLNELAFSKQVAFAYLACERAFPNYVYYSSKINFGDSDILREAIDFVYDSIFQLKVNNQRIEYLLALVNRNTPHTSEFPNFAGTIAMYCGGIIHESVKLVQNRNVSKLLSDISTMITDAVDCYIQERDDMDYNDPNFETKISNDSVMQEEVNIQNGIISYLVKIDKLEVQDIKTLLHIQNNKSVLII